MRRGLKINYRRRKDVLAQSRPTLGQGGDNEIAACGLWKGRLYFGFTPLSLRKGLEGGTNMLLYFALGGGGVKSLFLSGSASFRPIVQGREGCKSCPRLQNILLSLVMIYPPPQCCGSGSGRIRVLWSKNPDPDPPNQLIFPIIFHINRKMCWAALRLMPKRLAFFQHLLLIFF